ncbi:unnamed protein product [Diatraea saccharalis]|uniref:ABC transporter domain-containing protein n=1 Tax=Diatraea saccharalis TaxID=40085 RepID=A0A9N9QL96_9NEOP|nr:unnamed protein product [Diatraea saccharalis]
MEVFHFPVFVARNNLPAICLLIFLYGFACCSLMHVLEKLFNEPSVANMLLFCGNAFLGLGGLTVLLILDLISQSERTDDARWVLHKVFMLAPPFTLGDGLLEIAKNTIQAQVLSRFGMDTYKDPFSSDLVIYHYLYLILVGCTLFLLNLAIEYHCFDGLLDKLYRSGGGGACSGELERLEVAAERRRVQSAAARATHAPLRLRTIGNINAGFVDDSDKKREGSPGWGAGGGELCTALLGENGAGKSTTFSLLTGQLRPTTGQIFLNNEPAKHTQLCQGYISYCPQSDAIDPLLTVIRRTVDMFELSQYADTSAGALSGGNKRKLCTAIAFMSRSPLVLLDEPTSGMDPVSRACVSRVVRGACAGAGGGGGAAGRGVLLSTHQLRDARTLCTRAALLHRGTLRDILPLPLPHDRYGKCNLNHQTQA